MDGKFSRQRCLDPGPVFKKCMDPDPVCLERLDPDPICPERLDSDPDPVNIRPRLWAAFGRSENDQPIRVTVYPLALKISCSDM